MSWIGFDFINVRTDMSWREVLFGLEREFLDHYAPIDFAVHQLLTSADVPNGVALLAGAQKSDPESEIRELVEKLANQEPAQPVEEMTAKWFFIVFSKLLERVDCRERLSDAIESAHSLFWDEAELLIPDYPDCQTDAQVIEWYKGFVDELARKYAPKA